MDGSNSVVMVLGFPAKKTRGWTVLSCGQDGSLPFIVEVGEAGHFGDEVGVGLPRRAQLHEERSGGLWALGNKDLR